MKAAVDIVRKYGGIFICDEVQTGFGRTGPHVGRRRRGRGARHRDDGQGDRQRLPDQRDRDDERDRRRVDGRATSRRSAATRSRARRPTRRSTSSSTRGSPTTRRRMGAVLARGPRGAASGGTASSATCAVADSCSAWSSCATSRRATGRPPPDATLRVLEETKKRGLLIGRGGLTATSFASRRPSSSSRRDVDDALTILRESFAALEA